jgi:3-hydroxyisobutyrate dehydrogenase
MGLPLAFIGMGIMGMPMAGHLMSAGHRMTVHSRTKSRAQPLLDRGAAWADSPAAAATNADVIFICVTDTPDVQAVVEGDGGLLESIRPGQIIIDHSTICAQTTKKLAQRAAAKGAVFLDAPVSGGDLGARNATLSIMVGGDAQAYEMAKPLLALMGKTLNHCGPSGSGQLTKLVNQILVSLTNLAVCEALNFALANGLDGQKTIAAVAGGAAGSWQLANLGPKMLAGDFAPGFMIDLMQKDLRLVLNAATQNQLNLPGTKLVHQLFTTAQSAGDGAVGTQALFSVIKRMSKP